MNFSLIRLTLTATALAALSLSAHAQTAGLSASAQKAISNNPEVTARYNALRAAANEVDVARGGYLPQVNLNGSLGRDRDDIGNRTPQTASVNRSGIALSVNQMLWDGLATKKEVERLGHARLTRYRNGGASQTMLYNGMDERIQVVTTPAIGAADTRVYLYDLDHRIVGEYGATGTADIKAEYIWLMPEVGATGPTGGDDGLGGYMPLATAVGQAGTLNWLHTHHHGAPILTTNAAGTVVR